MADKLIGVIALDGEDRPLPPATLWNYERDCKRWFKAEVFRSSKLVQDAETWLARGGEPFPRSINYIVSRSLPQRQDAYVLRSLKAVRDLRYQGGAHIVGGPELMKAMLPYLDELLLIRLPLLKGEGSLPAYGPRLLAGEDGWAGEFRVTRLILHATVVPM